MSTSASPDSLQPEQVRREIPPLEGWLTVKETADRLGMTRQAVHKKILAGQFRSARRLGPLSKPYFIIREAEVAKAVEDKTTS